MSTTERAAVPTGRAAWSYQLPIQVRWGDFDMFAHLNNVTYYRYFETMIVTFLRDRGGLDWIGDGVAPFVAENSCRYLKPIDQGETAPFGGTITGALRIDRLGSKSVTYGLALFVGDDEEPAALGQWVHVFVERASGRTAPIPDGIRACYAAHLAPGHEGPGA